MCDTDLTDQRFLVIALKEEARSVLWEVGSSADPTALVESVMEDIQALGAAGASEDENGREELGRRIREILLRAAYATRPYCIRCGTCCTKGGPTLFRDDMDVLREGVVLPHHLVTIRAGEWIYSSESESMAQTEQEIVKVREVPGSRTCIFYRPGDKECGIYEFRPLQCRRQECWNPTGALRISDGELLTREDLLKATGSLWDIVMRHEERCSHAHLARTMAKLRATQGHSVQELLDILQFDHHVRDFVTENLRLDPDLLDFFFGRPLADCMGIYGLKVEVQQDGSFLLTPSE